MHALLKAALSRPLFCLALGLCLGIAPLPLLAPLPQALLIAASLALFLGSIFLLRSGQDSKLALALFFFGACLGALRIQPLARRLQAPACPYVAAARITATVSEDLGSREDSGRQALLLRDAKLEDLEAGSSREVPGKLRISYDPDERQPALGPGDRITFWAP